MQVYREIPVLSAAPNAQDQKTVPHKLYGILSIKELCSAAKWRDMAIEAIEDTFKNGKVPILTGGTGLYIKALIDGLSPIPSIPESVRIQAAKEYASLGGKTFKEQLSAIDSETAARLDENDSQRLIRAWEVYLHTGKPLSHYQNIQREKPPHDWFFNIHILLPERTILYNRINARFDTMVDNGMMDEVKAVHSIPNLSPLLSSLKALGLPHLRATITEKEPLESAIEKAKAASRQYAKRQYTWFRNQLPEGTDEQRAMQHHFSFGNDMDIAQTIFLP